MVVENAFGIFSQRWRLFDRRIPLDVKHVDAVVQACVCLHNFWSRTNQYLKCLLNSILNQGHTCARME